MTVAPDAFLKRWVAENVTLVPAKRRRRESERLAAACISDASAERITANALNQAASGDIASYIRNALQEAVIAGIGDASRKYT